MHTGKDNSLAALCGIFPKATVVTLILKASDKIIKIKNGQVDKILINENPTPVAQIEW